MTLFGDYEPEDGWDASDAPADQLENLRRRARLLYLSRQLPRLDTLDDIAEAVRRARARTLTARETLRADQLDADIGYLAGRL